MDPRYIVSGLRVKLPARPEDGIPEEVGILESDRESNGTVIVRVDDDHIVDPTDDGLREVPTEIVQEL